MIEQNKLRSLLLTTELPDTPVARTDSLPLQSTTNPTHSDIEELLGFSSDPTPSRPRERERDGSHHGKTPGLSLPPLPPPPAAGLGGLPAHFAALIPALMHLIGLILQELEATPLKLRALNLRRRAALASHLDEFEPHRRTWGK